MSEDVENCPFCGKEPASGLTFIPAAKWGGAPGGRRNDGVRCETSECILFNKIFLQLMWDGRRSPTGGAKIHMECKEIIQEYLGNKRETPINLKTLIIRLGESRDKMMEALHFVGAFKEPLNKTLHRLARFLQDELVDNRGWTDSLEKQAKLIDRCFTDEPGEICEGSRFEVLAEKLRKDAEVGNRKNVDLLLHGMYIEYEGDRFRPEEVTFIARRT